MAERLFNRGEEIFHQGDHGETFYRIIDGTVGIYVNYSEGEEHKLTELTKGQYVGEMAVIDSYPRSATAVALEDGTKLQEVSENELNNFFSESPDNIVSLMKYLSLRIRDLTKDYEDAVSVAETLNVAGRDTDELFDEKLKKYKYYAKANRGKMAKAEESAEAAREEKRSHSDGYAKRVEKYPKGTVICKEGETVECMYDLHWGCVGIYKNYGTPEQVLLTELYSDSFFGEMGMISGEPRSATAVSLDDETTVEIIYPEDFQDLFEQNPPKVDMILRHLSSRLRKLTQQYETVCAQIYDKLI